MKIAFIGAGRIANSHLRAIDPLRNQFSLEMAGAYDPNAESAAALAARWGGRAFNTMEELLDEPDLDAVYVVSPTPFHPEQAIAVAERGLALYLEKPVALDYAAAKSVRDAIHKAGIIHCVGLNWRYRGLVQQIRNALGTVGGPALMTARWFWFTPPVAWLRDRQKSGGQVLDQLIHLVDLYHYLSGPVESVTACYSDGHTSLYQDFNNWDVHALQLRFTNGCIGNIVSTYKLNIQMQDYVEVEIVADNMRFRLTDAELSVYDSEKCTTFLESGDKAMDMLGRTSIESAFLEGVARGEQAGIRTNIDEALSSLRTVFAANRSAEKRCTVEVSEIG
jgi:predicted dehydrogenase